MSDNQEWTRDDDGFYQKVSAQYPVDYSAEHDVDRITASDRFIEKFSRIAAAILIVIVVSIIIGVLLKISVNIWTSF